jgi:hypothetical protein
MTKKWIENVENLKRNGNKNPGADADVVLKQQIRVTSQHT